MVESRFDYLCDDGVRQPTIPGKIMKSNSPRTSELNPPDNITPSVATVLSGMMVLLPLGVFLIGLYSGAFKL
jgi:hypothetical protein